MATSVDRVELAGIGRSKTYNTMSTKHNARQPAVIEIHEEWAEKNGYRVAASNKRQAASVKRQATSNKRQALNGASSNKR